VIRRAAIVVGGFGLLLVGAALLILPGPGVPVLVAGLALLSLEFRWARRLRDWVLRRAERVTPASRGRRIAVGCAALAGAAGSSVAVGVWGVPGL
jgi:Putative transmembrane protein (PGPGW)